MARYVGAALALSCVVMAPWALWYFYPQLLSKCIATISEVLAGFKAWFTPPLLFLLMNVVVLALAFTSGFINQRPLNRLDGEEREDLNKTGENEEDDAEDEEEEREDALYPEVFSSFFGDGGMVIRRKPSVKHSVPAERKGRSFYPRLSHKLNASPSLVASPSPTGLRHAHTTPRTVTFDLKKPSAVAQASHGNGGDRDVDERADAFIGDFYKKMKLQQVDPYMERLERSYGR